MKDSPIWYSFDLGNESHFVKCIKKLEFIIRKSLSYEAWQKRTKYAVSSCPVCGESFEFVKPESHHHPVTLFDVVEGILHKHIDLNDLNDFTDLEICDEVMQQHFAKKVQYVVLCKHCHDKYHSNVPEVLECIDEAQAHQIKKIKEFYTKEL
jgi:transcription elongation factor Elf1